MDKSAVNKKFKDRKYLGYFARNYKGLLFISPAILGILIFTLVPVIESLYYSFFQYNAILPPMYIGFKNYVDAVTYPAFWKAVTVTLKYTAIIVPLNLVLTFIVGLFMNQKVKGIKVFRVIYYLPVLIPMIASSLIYLGMFNVQYGIINRILSDLGLPTSTFFTEAKSAMITFIFSGFFGLGGGMVLWIATFNGISNEIYECARLEGSGYWRTLFQITIPMCTPIIFYCLITGVIGTLQTFGSSMTLFGGGGGPDNSMLFYVVYIYMNFTNFTLGYCNALGWLLFIFIGILTAILFRFCGWIYYAEE